MTLKSSRFTNFNQYELNTIPDSLHVLLNQIKLEHYEELYEPEAGKNASLQDDLNAVLEVLRSRDKTFSHCRYLWMTLILVLAVEPTLEYYDPNNSLPRHIINIISVLLPKTINGTINISMHLPQNILDESINEIFKSHESYFQKKGVNYQAISEALDVFYNAMRVINYDQAVEAILEILYDCLEGYAIFPGSYGRRELFDWWLEDVVPASYNLLPPKIFYVVEGVKNKEEIRLRQTSLLSKISKEIASFLPELMLESNEHNNYIFPNPGKINRGAFKTSVKIPGHYHSKSDQLAYSR
ncbi:hypothetical protein [Anabaena lutea]|uniref:Uncharacterized protein n=1 Tax=Anabaena lutea FACHB-196 TaxID=2692881 RepID=A0ABR8FGS3_9NOST|nr:hypothetical protein [Anabaena lutea]MBD2568994.1 hypothetical protein [Anabaena lutea FACHB-196]